MVLPSSSNAVGSALVNKLLTNLSLNYVPDSESYISEQLLPSQNVVQWSGLIGQYGKEHLIIENTLAGGDTPYPRVTSVSRLSQSYQLKRHGLSQVISEETFANVESPFEPRRDATIALTTRLWLGKERSLASTLTDTAVITQNVTLAGTDQYSDYANSDPIGDFRTAREAINASVCVPPDTAIVPWEVWNTLRYHPALVDNIKYVTNASGGVTEAQLADAMGVRRILMPRSCYNSAKEGQTPVLSPTWGKDIVFCVAPASPQIMQTTLGYRFQFGTPRRVFNKVVDNPPNSEMILVDDTYQQVLTEVNAAYLIKDAVA